MTRSRHISTILMLTVAVLDSRAIFAQQGQLPSNERRRDDKQQQTLGPPPVAEIKPAVEGLAAAVDPNSYKIGAEDVIKVVVWKEPDLSFTAGVRPDGRVTAPLIGDLIAAGETPTSLAAILKEKLGELVNNPLVNVEIIQVRSKKYYITGQVSRTGMFPLVVPTTVLEALTMAGGLSEWADKKKIVIMRGEQRFIFNYDAAIKGGGKKGSKNVKNGKTMENNILLENGDFIVVN